MTRRRLEIALISEIDVASAGFLDAGRPMPEAGQRLMSRRGYDLSAHRSRQIDQASIDPATFILGMTREHLRSIVARWPDAWQRTFSFADFVVRAERTGQLPHGLDGEPWLTEMNAGRTRADALGESPDDIADPMGRPDRMWESVIERIDDLAGRLVALPDLGRPYSSTRRARHRRS